MGSEGGTRGWKLSGITADEYIWLLKAYDAELRKDSYVLGATPFTSGPTLDWVNYNMDGLEQYLIEEEPMPEDQIKAWLVDMWRRQGAEPNTDTDAFFAYALQVAKTQGRAIIPMLSKDSNYLNYSDPTRIVAYTIPPMWALKAGGPVQEGLPPN